MVRKAKKVKWIPLLGGVGLFVYSFFMVPETMRAYGELPVPQYANWVWGGLGLLVAWYGVWGHRLRYNDKAGPQICPSCHNVLEDKKQTVCPSCEVPLEPLKGFFDRYPEKKK